MALFGDDEGDVPPFDMTEDGDDWFQFTLDNLEMDRGCSPLQQDANPMEQEAIDFGDTDQDDDVDEPTHAGGSGPGPPATREGSDGSPRRRPRASRSNVTDVREMVVGKPKQEQEQQQQQEEEEQQQEQQQEKGATSRGLPVPPAKSRLEKVKLEAKEVQEPPVQKKLASEGAAAKRSSRMSRSEAKSRHRAAGGMAGGVGGMPGRAEAASTSSNKERAEGRTGGKAMSTSTSGNGGGGAAAARANSVQNRRRLERNAREQKRSLKISQRIEDLRRMLTQFGVDVKASKSAVLSEATDYIAHLQRQQAQFEAERARLLTLLQNATRGVAGGTTPTISLDGGGGELTDSAMSTSNSPSRATVKPPPTPSNAQEHTLPFSSIAGPGRSTTATASGGGNGGSENSSGSGFGKCEAQSTPKPWVIGEASETTAMTQSPSAGQPRNPIAGLCVPGQGSGAGLMPAGGSLAGMIPTGAVPLGSPLVAAAAAAAPGGGNTGILEATARALSHVNYERVFRTAPVPMAIANVNGNLVDCNTRLTQVTGFRREEALFLSIFDLVADPFLQHTFSMISSILSLRGVANPPFFQVLGKRRDGGPAGVVQISVVQDDALRPLHFCISVIESAAGPGATPVGPGGGGGGGGGNIPSAVGSTTSGVDTGIAVSGGGFVTGRSVVGEGRDSGGGRISARSSVAAAGARCRDGSGGSGGGGGGGAL